APNQIANPAKEESAKWTDHKADCERREISNQRERVVALRIEQRRDNRGQTSKDVEVIPLDHGAHRRRADDLPDASVFSHAGASSLSWQHSSEHFKQIVHRTKRLGQLRVRSALYIFFQLSKGALKLLQFLPKIVAVFLGRSVRHTHADNGLAPPHQLGRFRSNP